jgi:hypothetical protein
LTEPFKVNDLEITPRPEGWLKPIHPALGVIDGTAYVGVWIPSIVKDHKGHELEKTLLYIVTDKKERILANDEVLKAKGWRLRYKPILFENRWMLDDVEAYLNGSVGRELSPSDLLGKVIKTWKSYVWFTNEREYVFQALWDVGTYFHQLFNAYPYPYLGGVKRSAKTKVLTIHSCLAFNAIFSMNISTAALYRLIQNASCTVLIDENEKLNNPERAQEFRSILNAGYKKGQSVYRVEKTKKEQLVPEAFEVYSPKALANIRGLEDVIEDRCKTTIMKRSRDRSIVDREVDITAPLWQDLRNSIYRLFLTNWKAVKRCYDRLGELSEQSELVNFLRAHGVSDEDLVLLTSRELELWRPILALALFFDESTGEVSEISEDNGRGSQKTTFRGQSFDQGEGQRKVLPQYTQTTLTSLTTLILRLAIETAKARQAEDATESAETVLVGVLVKLVREDRYYAVKAILGAMEESFGKEEKWLNTKWVGRALKRLGFTEKRRVGAGIEYLLKKTDVEDLANRMQVDILSTQNGDANENLGTREKMEAVLHLVEELQAKSGSANLNELESLAEKEGIDRSEFGALIARMLHEGLIVETEDGKGVRRAGTKTPTTPTPTNTEANAAQPSTIDASLTCGKCFHYGKSSCIQPRPELIRPEAFYPSTCNRFERKNQEGRENDPSG